MPFFLESPHVDIQVFSIKTESITLGHISDLHFSSGASTSNPHSHSIPLLKQIYSVLRDRPLDRLIVSGDLTDKGDKESLLRVRDWLFGEFSISGTERIGLKLPPELVRVVPGNHDAYNSPKCVGTSLECWQKSVANYREAFPDDRVISGCRYEWLEKGDAGIYIVYVDSCFLGDPKLHRHSEFRKTLLASISKIARGKLSLRQSKQLIQWFDLGMTGGLANPNGDDAHIPKEKFAKSFKLLVMHHYLFEPPGFKDDFFLKVQHRDTVFKNIALADFDMYLCGHKHVNHFGPTYYGEHFDRRATSRYLWNLFARRMGVNTLPYRFEDTNGRQISNFLNRLIEIVALRVKRERQDGDQFIDELMAALKYGIENPTQFGSMMEDFVLTHRLSGKDVISSDDIQEIQSRVVSQLTKREREVLSATGLTYIKRIVKGMRARPFVQSMCGSSAKNSSISDPARSLNIYQIDFESESYKVKRERYNLSREGFQKTDDEFVFSNKHHVMLRGA